MEHIHKEEKHLHFIQRPNMQFGTAGDIYMATRSNEILIACNVNQWDL